jgi:hypothetical protein
MHADTKGAAGALYDDPRFTEIVLLNAEIGGKLINLRGFYSSTWQP